MSFFHGARAEIKVNSTFKVNAAASGIVVYIGTAPVNQVESYPQIVLAESYDEAVAALGYSDNWKKYTLCEAMYTNFKLYGVGPILLINVADPKTMKKAVQEATVPVVDGTATITEDAILSSIVVKSGEETLEQGSDYEAYFTDGSCIIAAITGGKMENLDQVTVSYDEFAFELEGLTDKVIGGYDTKTGISSGVELVDECYAMYQVNPDLIAAPGFSHIPEVAAAMNAKTTVNTLFRGMAIIDLDTETAKTYTDAVNLKEDQRMEECTEILCWPMVKDENHVYHLSTHLGALMAQVDSDNEDCPSESPSNKTIKITGTVLADGSNVNVNLTKANYLNGMGIVTAMNFIGGFRAWGNNTAIYPNSDTSMEYFIPVRRMFNWIANSEILTFWSFVDTKLNRRLCETIADSSTIWINGLTAAGHLYGGRVEFLEEENSDEDIAAGILRPHVYIAPPAPAQEIDFVLEYDASYVSEALGIS